MSSEKLKHDYHLVDPSPWPIYNSFACLVLAFGAVYYFHTKALWLLLIGTALLIYGSFMWFRDVVDEAEKRRGFPSINRVWKNKIAVLMGDFILSKTLINMVGLKDFAALQLIADTAEKLAAGEILQIEKSLTRSMTEEVYYDMIYQKTASLISSCCELGAITSTGKDKDRLAMINYGTKLGLSLIHI